MHGCHNEQPESVNVRDWPFKHATEQAEASNRSIQGGWYALPHSSVVSPWQVAREVGSGHYHCGTDAEKLHTGRAVH